MKVAVLLLFLLITSITQAADRKGNGGNVVVCTESNSAAVSSVELLDYFEVEQNGGTLRLNPIFGDYSSMLKDLFSQWAKVAPKRMALYSKWLSEFPQEAGFYAKVQIPATEDTGAISIPIGCAIQPAAFQRPDSEILPGVKRYTISKDLWDKMPEIQRAGLVLHELIYRESIQAAHTTSFPTRYFNGFLASATPDTDSYSAVVSQMPLSWVEFGTGLEMTLGEPEVTAPFYKRTGEVSTDGYAFAETIKITGNIAAKRLEIEFATPPDPEDFFERFVLRDKGFQLQIQAQELHLNYIFVDVGQYAVAIVNPITTKELNFNNWISYPPEPGNGDPWPPKYSIRIQVDGRRTFLELDPARSFYIQPDGSRITQIAKLLLAPDYSGRECYGPKLVTASGEVWQFRSDKDGYVKVAPAPLHARAEL